MATSPPAPDPRTVVKVTTKLWSDEVAIADAAKGVQPKDVAYDFSNGRRFTDPSPYTGTST